jgi:hypothetical protein
MTAGDNNDAEEHPLRHNVRFVRPKRVAVVNNHDDFPVVEKRGKSPQMVKTPMRATSVHVPNRPAKFPPAWPSEMRAETTAAFLDFQTTRELCKAIAKGEAPAPTTVRRASGSLEAIWLAAAVKQFVESRNNFKRDES